MLSHESNEDELGLDLFRDGIPFTALERLRREKPLFATRLPDGQQVWNLVRYSDVARVLASYEHYGVPLSEAQVDPDAEIEHCPEPWRLTAAMALNPPAHEYHKQRIAPNMRAEFIESFRPSARKLAVQMAREVQERKDIDAIEDFAAPLSAAFACAYIGIRPENRDYVRRLSANFMGDSLPPVEIGGYRALNLGPRATAAMVGSPMRAATELVHEAWSDAPWLDAAFVTNAGRWELEELALQTLTAGIAGLRNCIGTAVRCFAGQWYEIQSHKRVWLQNVGNIANEVLRYTTPLLRVRRISKTRVTWYSTEIAPGETFLVWLAGANFDNMTFPNPEAFDPLRAPNPHLSFSGGIHRCLGAPLAKMELEEVIRAMITTWETIELAAKPVYFPSNIVTEIAELRIQVG